MAAFTPRVLHLGQKKPRDGRRPWTPTAWTLVVTVVVVVVLTMVCFSVSITWRNVAASSEALGAWKCSICGLPSQNSCTNNGSHRIQKLNPDHTCTSILPTPCDRDRHAPADQHTTPTLAPSRSASLPMVRKLRWKWAPALPE